MSDNWMHRQLSKRMTSWSRTTLPGWWTAFMVVCGAAFFGYLAFGMMSGSDRPAPLPGPVAADSATAVPSRPSGAQPQLPDGPDVPAEPSAAAASPSAPAGPAPGGASAAVARVAGADGKATVVNREALRTVTLAFRSLFDPAAAAQVHTSDGNTLQPPMQASKGTVQRVRFAPQPGDGPDRLRFIAAVDADGAGPIPGADISLTVARTQTSWVLVLAP